MTGSEDKKDLGNENKRRIVSDLSEKLSKAEAVILTEYKGLTVADLTELRVQLRRLQGELRVLQNRLAKIALKGVPAAQPLHRYLTGATAAVITYSDPVPIAKALKVFAAEREKFKLKAGLVSGRFMEPEDLKRLANLPGRQTLVCEVVGLVSSPLRRLVTALSQPQRQLVQVLAQVVKKRGP